MAYPDDHVVLTTLFGASATFNAGTLSIDCSELSDVSSGETLTTSGIVLALLRSIQDNQGLDETRKLVMPVAGPSSSLVTRGGVSSLRETYTINIFDDFASELDPDNM